MKREEFFAYVRCRAKWFLATVLCGILMAAVLILNHAPNREIGYGALLCLFFVAVVGVWDFMDYRRHFRLLKGLESSVIYSLDGLPSGKEPLEREYQFLLELLLEEKMKLENESVYRQRDLTEYYTMWVHQIKTPIAALKLLLEEEGQENEAELSEEQRQLYAEKQRNEKLQQLFEIEQYTEMALHYMRLGSETNDFVLRKVSLDDVIKEAVHKYSRQFIRKKIALSYEAVETVVTTDEKWLEFVLEQLLSNALKYTPSGSIAICVEDGRLVITDTGIGIKQEDLPRVCEKGYTGYNGHADRRSTGIGLYLCNSILKKLGHTLSITSEEGRGTRVAIGFPQD